ncbi:MAG TPA: isoprenylcysteine carboxylmethyltransferase family protein [Solirubrobacteraceae bacterium]|nr:isoprenylcysteine carboxylmethyltransferase family protein [Solirubrobacteraceae bacterium]
MHTIRLAIGIIWIVFWVGWILAAAGANASVRTRRFPTGGLSMIAVIVLIRLLPSNAVLSVHSRALGWVGAAIFVAGLGLAVWARVCLGRNWGMPMTVRAEPELVTAGPYRFVRHPIYTGLLLGVLGTSLATSGFGLVVTALLTLYFYFVASVEERNMTEAFPTAYPEYRAHTKKLIPFVL